MLSTGADRCLVGPPFFSRSSSLSRALSTRACLSFSPMRFGILSCSCVLAVPVGRASAWSGLGQERPGMHAAAYPPRCRTKTALVLLRLVLPLVLRLALRFTVHLTVWLVLCLVFRDWLARALPRASLLFGSCFASCCVTALAHAPSNRSPLLLTHKSVKMTSSKRPKLPYEYYYLPFCRPSKLRNTRENLGEVLRGDRITNTPYIVRSHDAEREGRRGDDMEKGEGRRRRGKRKGGDMLKGTIHKGKRRV